MKRTTQPSNRARLIATMAAQIAGGYAGRGVAPRVIVEESIRLAEEMLAALEDRYPGAVS